MSTQQAGVASSRTWTAPSASPRPSAVDYSESAAQFIAGIQRKAALGLTVLPQAAAEAAVMRAAGYEVLAECTGLAGASAIVSVMTEDTDLEHVIPAAHLAAALGVSASGLPGMEFLAVLRETHHEGQVLSMFRQVPVRM